MEAWWSQAYPDHGYRQQIVDTWAANLDKATINDTDFEPIEVHIRCKDCSTKTVIVSAAPLENYFASEHLVILFDITDRIQIEEEHRKLIERISMATRSANVGIWDWDVQNSQLTWDDQMYALYGQKKEEFSGAYETWVNGLHPDDRAFCKEETRLALRGEKHYDTEFRVVWPDGSVHHLKAKGEVIRGVGWKPLRMIGVNYDITERKRAETSKSTLESQLQQAQKMESIGRLAGGVAHDFNNMLTIILGYTELILMQMEATSPFRSPLEEIKKASNRSSDLTRQLLAFARKQTIAPKVLDLNEVVTSMLNMLQRLIGEDIHLLWHPATNLWQIKMDPSQVDQILANLCVNARDAIANVGKITIETARITLDEEYCAANPGFSPGEFALLAVSDDGSGMNKITMAQIFEPFFTTKSLGEGTGLGLATVYGIVKQNKGFINVYSELGQGTTFKIYLPRYEGKSAQVRTEFTSKALSQGEETILLVEDDTSILKMTRALLERQGYTVLAASTPSEAIRLAKNHSGEIGLLLSDVILPDMNGRDLSDNLKILRPQLKCLFMSGYTANVIAHHGVLDEGVNFIHKPFTAEDLTNKVREVLDSKEL